MKHYLLLFGVASQLVLGAMAYGKLTQSVDELKSRVEKIDARTEKTQAKTDQIEGYLRYSK